MDTAFDRLIDQLAGHLDTLRVPRSIRPPEVLKKAFSAGADPPMADFTRLIGELAAWQQNQQAIRARSAAKSQLRDRAERAEREANFQKARADLGYLAHSSSAKLAKAALDVEHETVLPGPPRTHREVAELVRRAREGLRQAFARGEILAEHVPGYESRINELELKAHDDVRRREMDGEVANMSKALKPFGGAVGVRQILAKATAAGLPVERIAKIESLMHAKGLLTAAIPVGRGLP